MSPETIDPQARKRLLWILWLVAAALAVTAWTLELVRTRRVNYVSGMLAVFTIVMAWTSARSGRRG